MSEGLSQPLPQIPPQGGGQQEVGEGCLRNCHTASKSAPSHRAGSSRSPGLGLRSLGFEEALCACVLNYLCLSDEVSKRAPIQGLGFLSELIQDAFG